MKKKSLLIMCLVMVLVLSLVGACAKPAPAPAPAPTPVGPEWVWNFQSLFPMADQSWDENVVVWKERFEAASNGRLQINIFPPGTFCGDDELVDAISKGTLEAGLECGPYCKGDVGAVAHLSSGFPGSWSNIDDAYNLIYEEGLIELLREGWAGVNIFFVSNSGNSGVYIQTTFPVNTLADLNGKKIRATGVYSDMLSGFGVACVDIPPEDIYMGLKLGTIDGVVYTAAELTLLKWMEVVDYVLLAPAIFDPAPVDFVVNMDRWNELPADVQQALIKAGQEEFKPQSHACAALGDAAFKAFEADGGQFTKLGPEDMKKWYDVADKNIWSGWSKEDALFAKGAEIIKNYYASQ